MKTVSDSFDYLELEYLRRKEEKQKENSFQFEVDRHILVFVDSIRICY